MKLRCLIVDDEPLAQRVVEKYAHEVSYLEIAGKCASAMEAMEILHARDIDLIFLDINMPGLSGIDFLKSRKSSPMVIITTAYAEFAIQGYELDVTDYLMKPFSFERFLKAVEKARDIFLFKLTKPPEKPEEKESEKEIIFVKSSKKTYRVNLDKILYIEALGDYVKIFTEDRMIVSYQSLKNIESMLPSLRFPRVHKSFIISLSKIDLIENNQIRIRERLIPIGTNYKSDFEQLIISI
jgi:DNA-binding LytR/AlgR family response regulator